MRIIEFMGTPNAGLHPYVEISRALLEEAGLDVSVHIGGKKKDPFDYMNTVAFNIHSAEEVISKLMESFPELTDTKRKVNIFERGLWDHLAFLLAMARTGKITPNQYQEIRTQWDPYNHLDSAVVMVGINCREAMENYLEQPKLDEGFIRMYSKINNPRFIKELCQAYCCIYYGLIEQINPNNVLIINGEGTLNKNIAYVAQFLKRVVK